jgi:hypothetical protein
MTLNFQIIQVTVDDFDIFNITSNVLDESMYALLCYTRIGLAALYTSPTKTCSSERQKMTSTSSTENGLSYQIVFFIQLKSS